MLEGNLCLLDSRGSRVVWHAPLASAIVEFRRAGLRTYVREHPFGLLPGLSNLYCLDGAHRLQWMAEWPDPADPCASIVGETDGVLVAIAASGAVVRLDVLTGRLIDWTQARAAAS